MTGEAALARALQVAADGVRDGVWLLDGAGRTTWINAAMADLLGCRREDVLGEPLFDRVDLVDAPTSELTGRRRLTRWDGTTVWVRMTATTVTDAAGHETGAAIVIEHIGADTQPVPELRSGAEGSAFSGMLPAPRAAADDDSRALERISELAGSGASLNTIAAALNADGLVAPKGRRWHASSVARVLYRSS